MFDYNVLMEKNIYIVLIIEYFSFDFVFLVSAGRARTWTYAIQHKYKNPKIIKRKGYPRELRFD